jgi:hypothetical protein|tara:strand:+ start:420 stop:659 length:240 start_codon:yes stop_codon:yes gene_type:complete
MDKEVQESYDKMFDTLSTEGWGIIKQRLLEMYAQQNNLLNIQDEKTFWQQRGALGMIHLMIEFETVLKNELEQAEQNAE